MKRYISIDSGTTNTRARLMDETGRVLDSVSEQVGVRNTAIDGNNSRLATGVKTCIDQLMERHELTWEQIAAVFASGMITSDVGLYELPHVTAPAGLTELAAGAASVLLSDVCPLPITFIPGVKNKVDPVTMENFEAMDIMRGEEVEAMAVVSGLEPGVEYLLVLPGSHTKFVKVDAEGKIQGCLTTLCGELLEVLTKNTILASSVNHSFVEPQSYDRELVLAGYRTAKQVGMGRAAFSTRIYERFVDRDPSKAANFLLGAVIAGDVLAAENSSALHLDSETVVIVAGKEPLKQAIIDVMSAEGTAGAVLPLRDADEANLSARGAFEVIRRCMK